MFFFSVNFKMSFLKWSSVGIGLISNHEKSELSLRGLCFYSCYLSTMSFSPGVYDWKGGEESREMLSKRVCGIQFP
uniref:L1 unspliced fusion gene protein n=1 Tax=Mus musculus TaxID=10090 RepID=C6EQK2_MOUSE|nr:L1 unspliced fusion gene protein [Mus musculus]